MPLTILYTHATGLAASMPFPPVSPLATHGHCNVFILHTVTLVAHLDEQDATQIEYLPTTADSELCTISPPLPRHIRKIAYTVAYLNINVLHNIVEHGVLLPTPS